VHGDDDTIAAIATAPGGGGIGIVRVSGPDAEAVLRAVVRPLPSAIESRRVYVGRAHDPRGGAPLDEVVTFLMRSPRTYTGEDVVELQGHGGVGNLARLLEAVLGAGARLAAPGEFTRRAFLSGRLDLSQAEAVAEVIAARGARALRLAHAQLRGALGARAGELQSALIAALADVEGTLDFPDDVSGVGEGVAAAAARVAAEARTLAATYGRGRAEREGVEVALVGRANVGKSSLLNALVGEERAVVDALPHTTRDYLEVPVEWDGVAVTLIDTAGADRGARTETDENGRAVRGTGSGDDASGGAAQARGMALGRQRAERADVVLVLVEATVAASGEEEALWAGLPEGCARVLVRSKGDLCVRGRGVVLPPWAGTQVVTSTVSGAGLDEVRRAVLHAGGVASGGGEAPELVLVASARQRDALLAAAAAAEAAATQGAQGAPGELVAVELRAAAGALGRITGTDVTEDVLQEIFGRFCIGK
jgi:tRNA modification GTPase